MTLTLSALAPLLVTLPTADAEEFDATWLGATLAAAQDVVVNGDYACVAVTDGFPTALHREQGRRGGRRLFRLRYGYLGEEADGDGRL